jgi:DNA-directed RNA polymerase specialized sigma24 family protein
MATSMALGILNVRDEEALEAIEDERGTVEEEAIREQMNARVRAAIAERPERERKMLEGYYFEGKSLEEASGGLSRSWSSRLLATATSGVALSLRRAGFER